MSDRDRHSLLGELLAVSRSCERQTPARRRADAMTWCLVIGMTLLALALLIFFWPEPADVDDGSAASGVPWSEPAVPVPVKEVGR